ncbi:hypothetical protein [Variovorax sp. ZT5R36]|uniref:hypothetical protein n=1 Tax=Variovorax sp. ZT5R36 TaxID=3443734 RepID=UPI003F49AA30
MQSADAAAGARAHGVHAPAEANRGDQLVVGTHGVVKDEVQKNKNPGGTNLPGFSIPEGATPSERNRGRCQVAMLASMAWMNFMVG